MRSKARPAVRTRSTGTISYPSERIGLIFSVPPSQAWALPMRPPRLRYSSVSTQNHIFSASRAWCTRATTASLSAPAQARIEGVKPDHLQLALLGFGAVEPAHIEADLADCLAVREASREVVRAVGDDRDRGHSARDATATPPRALPTRTSR